MAQSAGRASLTRAGPARARTRVCDPQDTRRLSFFLSLSEGVIIVVVAHLPTVPPARSRHSHMATFVMDKQQRSKADRVTIEAIAMIGLMCGDIFFALDDVGSAPAGVLFKWWQSAQLSSANSNLWQRFASYRCEVLDP